MRPGSVWERVDAACVELPLPPPRPPPVSYLDGRSAPGKLVPAAGVLERLCMGDDAVRSISDEPHTSHCSVYTAEAAKLQITHQFHGLTTVGPPQAGWRCATPKHRGSAQGAIFPHCSSYPFTLLQLPLRCKPSPRLAAVCWGTPAERIPNNFACVGFPKPAKEPFLNINMCAAAAWLNLCIAQPLQCICMASVACGIGVVNHSNGHTGKETKSQ